MSSCQIRSSKLLSFNMLCNAFEININNFTTMTLASDCDVGDRKKRTIRDNLFVVNRIIKSVVEKDAKPIDIEVIDISKSCDSLWLKECLIDLYEDGLTNNNLNLLYEGNIECFLALKTHNGHTQRIEINEIVMHGSVWGPLCYSYSLISIPPLGMVDDELTISECGSAATLTNAIMNNFTESNFGIKKCNKIHVGNKKLVCEEIKVHDEYGKTVQRDKYVHQWNLIQQ